MTEQTQSHLSLEETNAVARKLAEHVRRRDQLIEKKRETASNFTKRIKEENGIINDLAEQIEGTADQPGLPGTYMDE